MPQGTGVPGCEVTNECFVPADVSVDVGGSVTWTNSDSVLHTVSAGDLKADPTVVGYDYPNGFQSGLVNPGDEFVVEDLKEGDYPYFCSVHPWMKGMLYVTAAHGDDDGKSDSMTVGGSNMDDTAMMEKEMTMEEKEMMMAGDDEGKMMTGKDDDTAMMDKSDESMVMQSEIPESIDDVMVMIETRGGSANSPMQIDVKFTDADGNDLTHVNYRVTAMQDGKAVIQDGEEGSPAHSHMGEATHTTDKLDVNASKEMPVDITVELYGFGKEEVTGPSGVVASYKAVPEFGTVAMMVLAVAIVSIVAITAKTRLAPRI